MFCPNLHIDSINSKSILNVCHCSLQLLNQNVWPNSVILTLLFYHNFKSPPGFLHLCSHRHQKVLLPLLVLSWWYFGLPMYPSSAQSQENEGEPDKYKPCKWACGPHFSPSKSQSLYRSYGVLHGLPPPSPLPHGLPLISSSYPGLILLKLARYSARGPLYWFFPPPERFFLKCQHRSPNYCL